MMKFVSLLRLLVGYSVTPMKINSVEFIEVSMENIKDESRDRHNVSRTTLLL